MALTDIEKSFIYNYSTQLLQQDILTNALFANSSVGASLRSMVLNTPQVNPPSNPFEQAITGTLRADAAAYGQSARNVAEAASMVGIAEQSTETIKNTLNDMEEIITKINDGTLTAGDAAVQENYENLRDKITTLISDTNYNGIYFMDSSKWGTNQIDANGGVFIQSSPNGGFDTSFFALDGLGWNGLVGANLVTDINGQQTLIDTLQGKMDSINDLYEGRLDSLNSQVVSLNSQSALLEKAASARMPSSSGSSIEDILRDLILKEVGNLVSTDA